MKYIIFIILLTIHFGLLTQNIYSCAHMNFKGKVKMVIDNYYSSSKIPISSSFDTQGRLLTWTDPIFV